MSTIRSVIVPHRLSALFADTKRSYENVVQTNYGFPQLSSLHLQLRIQKDRLVAWGLEWSDANAAQADDIDRSLDRAGIADLVASIMSSIRDLLDEAEQLQPSQPFHLSASFPDFKSDSKRKPVAQWTPANIERLEEILKELTASIDTLCDLSAPKTEEKSIPKSPSARDNLPTPPLPPRKESSNVSKSFPDSTSPLNPESGQLKEDSKLMQMNAVLPSDEFSVQRKPSTEEAFLMKESAFLDHFPRGRYRESFIHSSRLRILAMSDRFGSSPPSYESVAAGSEDRVLAYYSDPSKSGLQVPVLIDYGPVFDETTVAGLCLCGERYDQLILGLQSRLTLHDSLYDGMLNLVGWSVDSQRACFAYIYGVPSSIPAPSNSEPASQPRSLLSFLQHSADTDSANMPSLEDRFRLACNLTNSLFKLFANGVLHGNLNSNNILFFPSGNSVTTGWKIWKEGAIRQPYLASLALDLRPDAISHKDPMCSSIYRHPLLEFGGISRYVPEFDIYSLGLVLLEIGLWMPLGKFWKSKYTKMDFKSRLQGIYVKKLSAKCGNGYMNAVLNCLKAADSLSTNSSIEDHKLGSSNLSPDFVKEVAEQIIRPLERCCMIEAEGSSSPVSRVLPMRRLFQPQGNPREEEAGKCNLLRAARQSTSCSEQSAQNVLQNALKAEKMSSEKTARRKIKVWSHEIPSLYTSYWNSTMLPKLTRILKKAINRWESYSIDLFMAGEDAESARPTICMECASTEIVHKVLRYLNKEMRLFEIKVVKGEITRSKAGKKKKSRKTQKKTNAALSTRGEERCKTERNLNPHYQEKPSCGASIGVFHNDHHLPPTSLGGTVLIDGEPYGMSVHHMLDDNELDLGLDLVLDPQRSCDSKARLDYDMTQQPSRGDTSETVYLSDSSGDEQDAEGLSVDFEDSETFDFTNQAIIHPETLYPFEILEDEVNASPPWLSGSETRLSDDFEAWCQALSDDETEEDEIAIGDTLGIDPGQGEGLVITQPALDDVDDEFFPEEEDKNEEHLSSHSFGHVYASSGIRRARRKDILHEIDWAVIKVDGDRLQSHNVVPGGGHYCSPSTDDLHYKSPSNSNALSLNPEDSYPCQVASFEDLGGLHVHALGRTSGLQTGVILPAMKMVRMAGRTSPSHSWQVKGNFGGKALFFASTNSDNVD